MSKITIKLITHKNMRMDQIKDNIILYYAYSQLDISQKFQYWGKNRI